MLVLSATPSTMVEHMRNYRAVYDTDTNSLSFLTEDEIQTNKKSGTFYYGLSYDRCSRLLNLFYDFLDKQLRKHYGRIPRVVCMRSVPLREGIVINWLNQGYLQKVSIRQILDATVDIDWLDYRYY